MQPHAIPIRPHAARIQPRVAPYSMLALASCSLCNHLVHLRAMVLLRGDRHAGLEDGLHE